MRKLFQVSLITFSLLAWGCGKKTDTQLFISANPTSPYLIPQSTPVNDNPNVVTPTAPYFNMNSITLTWAGSSSFQLLSLALYAQSLGTAGGSSSPSTSTTQTSFNCGGSGSAIQALFTGVTFFDHPSGCSGSNGAGVAYNGMLALDSSGNITMPPLTVSGCVISVRSLAFYCDSLPITVSSNPFATYNIPIQVIVFGETLDVNGNTTGRVNGIGNITVQ